MEELLNILSEIKPGIDFKNEVSLIDDGILDSLSIIRLVGEIEDEFDVSIGVADLVPENFNTVQDIMALINRIDNEE